MFGRMTEALNPIGCVQSLMDARRYRDVAQIPTPALLSCLDNRYGRQVCRPEDWDHPDGAGYWV